jgi:hypothetical protein
MAAYKRRRLRWDVPAILDHSSPDTGVFGHHIGGCSIQENRDDSVVSFSEVFGTLVREVEALGARRGRNGVPFEVT